MVFTIDGHSPFGIILENDNKWVQFTDLVEAAFFLGAELQKGETTEGRQIRQSD